MNIGSYFEIPVVNLSRAMAFYSKIFDLEFTLFEIHGSKWPCFQAPILWEYLVD